MATLPKPTETKDFLPALAGMQPAICFRVIDLGTQDTMFKEAHQVLLSFELRDEEARMEDGRPMTIHKRYTWSMHEKATLRKHLESWRGKKFTDADFGEDGFDVRNLLGVPCVLNIVHNEKETKTYANIDSIGKLPKGMAAGKLENPTVYLWLDPDEFDRGVFDALPERLQITIKKSPEYHDVIRGKKPAAAGARVSKLEDEEIPFAPEWRG